MITDKRLQYLETVEECDFYKFTPSLFHYFYTPMAYYERLFSRTVRETLDYAHSWGGVFSSLYGR